MLEPKDDSRPPRIMVWGVGAFTQSVMHILKNHGAEVSAYLIREQGHYGPSLEGKSFPATEFPNPCPLLRELQVDFVIPMSIDWIMADWLEEFLALNIPIFSPTHAGMRLERDRQFASRLGRKYGVPFPKSFVARNRLEAENILRTHPLPYVIKNPLCSPTSPVHTIVCESVEDTRSWLPKVNYEEGVFLQEYMGHREAGHIALVSGGEIYSLITNQEYKRAFDGNMGIVAGAPLGGLVEQDPEDKYHLARELLHPLLPWFHEVDFHGPVQVTGIRRKNRWYVLEYNVRIGITCGPIILEMLQDPLRVLQETVANRRLNIHFKENLKFGCSITLAGYGYPYAQVNGPRFPVTLNGNPDCDLWWNDVAINSRGQLYTNGHRLADVIAVDATLEGAIDKAYQNIRKVRCLGSYYRTDVGKSLWPPGNE